MKHFKLLLLFLFLSGWTHELVHAQCSPTLREIYDFEVGDQFFYRITDRSDDARGPEYYYDYENFEIMSKYVNGDTLRYVRKSDKNLLDTLLIVDSINHPLNGCNYYRDTIINQSCLAQIKEPWAHIYISRHLDRRKLKMFGSFQLGNMYLPNDSGYFDFTFIDFTYYSLSCYSIYKEGLGLFNKGEFWFENGEFYELQKRIRGTDTISIKLSTPTTKLSKAIAIYPNPAVSQCTVKSPLQIQKIVVLNAHGQIQHIDVLERHQKTATLDTKDLAAGIYYIRIQTSSGYAIKKFVKL